MTDGKKTRRKYTRNGVTYVCDNLPSVTRLYTIVDGKPTKPLEISTCGIKPKPSYSLNSNSKTEKSPAENIATASPVTCSQDWKPNTTQERAGVFRVRPDPYPPESRLSESELAAVIQRVGNGTATDEELQCLVATCHNIIWRVNCKAGNKYERDAYQEAWKRIMTYARTYDPQKSKATTWVWRVAASCVSYTQYKYGRREIAKASYEEALRRKELREEPDDSLRQYISRLPERQRRYAELYMDGMSDHRIAEALGVTRNTLKAIRSELRYSLQ